MRLEPAHAGAPTVLTALSLLEFADAILFASEGGRNRVTSLACHTASAAPAAAITG